MIDDVSAPAPAPRLVIRSMPAVELVLAAVSFSKLWQRRMDEEQPGVVISPDLVEWRERIFGRLSVFQRSDIDVVFSSLTTIIGLVGLAVKKGHVEADDLIGTVRGMSDDEFLGHYREALKVPSDADLSDPETLAKALAEENGLDAYSDENEAQILAQSLRRPAEFRSRLADTLEWFWSEVLEPEWSAIAARVREVADQIAAIDDDGVAGFLDRATSGNYESLFAGHETITILPIRVASHALIVMLRPVPSIVGGHDRLAASLRAPDVGEEVRRRTEDLLKALSDPTRLAIMRLLRDEPRYGKQLADELSISAATASYHVDKLMQVHLVQLQISQGRRIYYGINPRGVRELQDVIATEFLPVGDSSAVT